MRKAIIPAAIMLGITTFGINVYNNYQNEQLIDRIRKSEYNPQTMIEVKLEEIRKQEEMDKKIQEQIEELAEYIGSDEYKLREETRSWRLPRGISIDQLQPIMMEISYYSDLAIENSKYGNITAEYKLREETRSWRLPRGISIDQLQPIMMEISYYSDLAIENSKYGNITATGKTLQNGMIANNYLDFGTNVYIEGEGMKVVEDRLEITKRDIYRPITTYNDGN